MFKVAISAVMATVFGLGLITSTQAIAEPPDHAGEQPSFRLLDEVIANAGAGFVLSDGEELAVDAKLRSVWVTFAAFTTPRCDVAVAIDPIVGPSQVIFDARYFRDPPLGTGLGNQQMIVPGSGFDFQAGDVVFLRAQAFTDGTCRFRTFLYFDES